MYHWGNTNQNQSQSINNSQCYHSESSKTPDLSSLTKQLCLVFISTKCQSLASIPIWGQFELKTLQDNSTYQYIASNGDSILQHRNIISSLVSSNKGIPSFKWDRKLDSSFQITIWSTNIQTPARVEKGYLIYYIVSMSLIAKKVTQYSRQNKINLKPSRVFSQWKIKVFYLFKNIGC